MAYIFITKEKTNWKYLLIIFILGVIVGAGTLWLASEQVFPPAEFPETKKPEKIEEELEQKEISKNFIPYEKTLTKYEVTIGYKIIYPSDWVIREDIEWVEGITTVFVPSNEAELENPLHNFIVFVGHPEDKRTLEELKEFVIKDSCDTVLGIENITIGSLPTYKLKCVIDDINSDIPPLVLRGPLISIEIVTLKPIEILGRERSTPARAKYIAEFENSQEYIDEINEMLNSFEIL